MDATLQADFQAVADKDQVKFSITKETITTETVEFSPLPAQQPV
jgi:hypothetical protein